MTHVLPVWQNPLVQWVPLNIGICYAIGQTEKTPQQHFKTPEIFFKKSWLVHAYILNQWIMQESPLFSSKCHRNIINCNISSPNLITVRDIGYMLQHFLWHRLLSAHVKNYRLSKGLIKEVLWILIQNNKMDVPLGVSFSSYNLAKKISFLCTRKDKTK